MKILIENGRVINPNNSFNEMANVLVEDGKVVQISTEKINAADCKVIDASNRLVTPGLIDIHVHFRDPGFTHKETIATGTRSAAAGGFTAVVCMPNTKPTVDTKETLEYVLQTAEKEGIVHLYSSAAMTYGIKGDEMTNMDELHQAGAITFTDDGRSVMDPNILYRAFEKAAELDVPICSHCEDHNLVKGGAINRGAVSEQLGDMGIPRLAEELVIARDILFAEETGARLHIQHISTARGVQLVREAKHRGVRVTCEAAPHHFSITDEIIKEVGAMGKVNPPLRTAQDVEAVLQGLQDGTIDLIATDHAPHSLEEKNSSLQLAPFGLLGLETCVGLAFTKLVHNGVLTAEEVIRKLTVIPAQVMGLNHGNLEVGGPADVTIIDPNLEWIVDADSFHSKSRNTPFNGMKLKGKAVATIVNGNLVYEE
jgi:dihydroorotase